MTESLVLKWAWRHYSLDVEMFESLRGAVLAVESASDYGFESLDCIEVWDENGYRKIGMHDVWVMADEIVKERPPVPPSDPFVATVDLTSPDGKDGTLDWFRTAEEAEAEAAKLRVHLGDRVKVRLLAAH